MSLFNVANVLIILYSVGNTPFADLIMLQLQGGAGKAPVNEAKALNRLVYSARARRTLCKYPGCDLKPYLDSKSATTFKKRRKKIG